MVETQVDLTGLHVLVVDDDADTLEVFRIALQLCGANVITARTARDALTMVKTVRLDAVVSDLQMPGEDGLWLADQLRRFTSETGFSIPALAVTAHWDRYSSERAKAAGFEAFAGKPIDPLDLSRRVAALVRR